MEKPAFKELYSFVVDKQIEEEVKTVKKKDGEEITSVKKVKKTVPLTIALKRPSRRDLEEAELEFSVEMSRCVKKGILTKAMLAKKYSDTGGLMSETDAQSLVEAYKKIFDLQNEFSRLEIVQNKSDAQKTRVEEISKELAKVRRSIVEFESNYQSLFDHTADVKAQNRLILWYVVMLTHFQDEEGAFVPYFGNGSFEDRLEVYYEKEEGDDPLYFLIAKKAATVMAFWFFNQASDKSSFDELMTKLENNEL